MKSDACVFEHSDGVHAADLRQELLSVSKPTWHVWSQAALSASAAVGSVSITLSVSSDLWEGPNAEWHIRLERAAYLSFGVSRTHLETAYLWLHFKTHSSWCWSLWTWAGHGRVCLKCPAKVSQLDFHCQLSPVRYHSGPRSEFYMNDASRGQVGRGAGSLLNNELSRERNIWPFL